MLRLGGNQDYFQDAEQLSGCSRVPNSQARRSGPHLDSSAGTWLLAPVTLLMQWWLLRNPLTPLRTVIVLSDTINSILYHCLCFYVVFPFTWTLLISFHSASCLCIFQLESSFSLVAFSRIASYTQQEGS